MNPHPTSKTFTAFQADQCIGTGSIETVALAAKAIIDAAPDTGILFFDDETGREIDLNLRGSEAEVLARLALQFPPPAPSEAEDDESPEPSTRGRGRPKLGVISHEVSLLPRHWEWLNSRPGSPSAALRKLIDEARRSQAEQNEQQRARKACFLFISAVAGNNENFEDACRALFAGDRTRFLQFTQALPTDVRRYAERLSATAFSDNQK